MSEITVAKYEDERRPFHSRWFVWASFIAIHTVLSIVLIVILGKVFTDFKGWVFLAGGLVYLLGWMLIIYHAWTQVEEKWEYILEIFGSYTGDPLKDGLQLIFPYFNFMFIRAKVFMGTQSLPLYLDEKEGDKSQGGAVDFEDGSAPVSAKVFFRIIDSTRATYEVDDVISGIEEKIDAAVRAYLSKYTIDEASVLKTHFDTDKILNGVKIRYNQDVKKIVAVSELGDGDGTSVKPDNIKEELSLWGVKIESIVITDIILSEDIKKARRQVLEAQKEAESAVHTAEKIITLATANKEEKKLDGQGYKMEIDRIVKTGVSPEQAVLFLQKKMLYENIGNNAVIIDSGNGSSSSEAAKFGAAFRKGADSAEAKVSKVVTKASADETDDSSEK